MSFNINLALLIAAVCQIIGTIIALIIGMILKMNKIFNVKDDFTKLENPDI